jgi:hypothetical protein
MSNGQVKLEQFDEWLKDNSDMAALVMRQWLEPVEGKDTVMNGIKLVRFYVINQ